MEDDTSKSYSIPDPAPGGRPVYNWGEMEVNGPPKIVEPHKHHSAITAARQYAYRHWGFYFSERTDPKTGVKSIWRVS